MNPVMLRTATPIEIYLKPGEFHFGGGNARIHTLLGSCVAITLWHPVLHVGGMCHFLLPSRDGRPSSGLDGRYADEAMQLFLQEIGQRNTRPDEYQTKLFGGGNMFPRLTGKKATEVGVRNVEAARFLLLANDLRIQSEDMGGNGHRRIILDLRDGHVWVRHEKI
jgi:chemotaxis protein CheD